jgi:hypothetical protein
MRSRSRCAPESEVEAGLPRRRAHGLGGGREEVDQDLEHRLARHARGLARKGVEPLEQTAEWGCEHRGGESSFSEKGMGGFNGAEIAASSARAPRIGAASSQDLG